MSKPIRQLVRLPLFTVMSALLWGVLEFVALQRARLATPASRDSHSESGRGARRQVGRPTSRTLASKAKSPRFSMGRRND